MNAKNTQLNGITAVLVDERYEITLDELCVACQVDRMAIQELVEEGVVEPKAGKDKPWRFNGDMLTRAIRAFRLQRDLKLNTAGVAVVLDLLGEIDNLRQRLYRLEAGMENIHD